MIHRILTAVLVAGFLIATASVEPRAADRAADPPNGPAMVGSQAGSIWFCAAGSASTVSPITHQLELVNTSGSDLHASIEGFGTSATQVWRKSVTVTRLSTVTVSTSEIGEGVESLSIIFDGAGGLAQHRFLSNETIDTATCQNSGAPAWHFAAASTELRTTSSKLHLFNPFPSDASVNVSIVTADGVHTPESLNGIRVAGRSAMVIELAQPVPLYASFAISVTTQVGRLVAELTQSTTATTGQRGLRILQGVAEPRGDWVFADGFAGEGFNEELTVYNPNKESAEAVVQVYPSDITDGLPEPFVVSVGGRRTSSLHFSGKTPGADAEAFDAARLPKSGPRWIRVSSKSPVVVNRVVSIVAAGGSGGPEGRPSISAGQANSTGTSVISKRLTFASVSAGTGKEVLVIANPSPDQIAVVRVSQIGGGQESAIIDRIEVPPNGSLPIDLSEFLSEQNVGLAVERSSAVAGELRVSSQSRSDFSVTTPAYGSAEAEYVSSPS